MMSNSEPSIEAENWVMSLDGKCNLKYEFGNNYLYIKNDRYVVLNKDIDEINDYNSFFSVDNYKKLKMKFSCFFSPKFIF